MSQSGQSSESVIEIRNLGKVYRDFWGRPKVKAVNALSLDVRRGEVFGLLGPNGSGKTTTLKLLLGLLFPSEGEIKILGKSTLLFPQANQQKAMQMGLHQRACKINLETKAPVHWS